MKDLRFCLFHQETNEPANRMAAAMDAAGYETQVFHASPAGAASQALARWLVGGEADYLVPVYKRIDEFDPDLILVWNSEGTDPEGLLCLFAEAKEIPLVDWLADETAPFGDERRDRAFKYVCYGMSDSDRAAQWREQGFANAFEAPADRGAEPMETLARLLERLEELGVAKGAVKRGEMTQRVLSAGLKPRILKLAADFYENDMLDETNRLVAKAQEGIPIFVRDDRKYVEELLEYGLAEPAMILLDRYVAERPSVELCLLAATLARDLGLYQEAIKYATVALEKDPAEPAALELVKECFAKLNQPSDGAPEGSGTSA